MKNLAEKNKENAKLSETRSPGLKLTTLDQEQFEASGATRDRVYTLLPLVDYKQKFRINSDLAIDELIVDELIPKLKPVPQNIIELYEYGLTGLLNSGVTKVIKSPLQHLVY